MNKLRKISMIYVILLICSMGSVSAVNIGTLNNTVNSTDNCTNIEDNVTSNITDNATALARTQYLDSEIERLIKETENKTLELKKLNNRLTEINDRIAKINCETRDYKSYEKYVSGTIDVLWWDINVYILFWALWDIGEHLEKLKNEKSSLEQEKQEIEPKINQLNTDIPTIRKTRSEYELESESIKLKWGIREPP
jgi:chromosome segregation ATPase